MQARRVEKKRQAKQSKKETPLVARDGCTATILDGPWSEAGIQTMAADPQTCTSGSCSFSISHGVSVTTSLTSTTDQSFTATEGVSVSVTAGVDFFAVSEVSVSASLSMAESIGTSTSQGYSNATTVTVTNNIGQKIGTTGFATFTPTYLCWRATVDCGSGVSDPVNMCNPQYTTNSDGSQTLQGDYSVVYI
jgi:hypothetical protein